MKLKYSFIVLTMLGTAVYAQPSLVKLNTAAAVASDKGTAGFSVLLNAKVPTQATIKIDAGANIKQADAASWFATQMSFRRGVDEMRLTGTKIKLKSKHEIEKIHQYYKGIRVEFGMASVLSKDGKLKMIQAEFYPVPENINTQITVTGGTAFQKAKDIIKATKYVWEGYTGKDPKYTQPAGTLVIIENPVKAGEMLLCYKFRIYATEPESYNDVFINAADGSLVYKRNLQHQPFPAPKNNSRNSGITTENYQIASKFDSINTEKLSKPPGSTLELVDGFGTTRYSGTKAFSADNGNPDPTRPFRLQALNYNFNHDIITKNYEERIEEVAANDQLAKDFTDNDNVWNEYNDADAYTPNPTKSGVDVHFNMQVISDYWLNRHERNSWDNNGAVMTSYVNTKSSSTLEGAQDNATWKESRKAMFYRIGSFAKNRPQGWHPVTALDVSAHEMGHAICDGIIPGETSDNNGLKYEAEPGALNEGFSDIWAACIENYFNTRFPAARQKNVWLMGEDFDPAGGFRNFKNPKLNTDKAPDYYFEEGAWASLDPADGDEGGVHTNSSVFVKWFSLITDGGSGFLGSDSKPYQVEGMGFLKAEQLVYATENMLTFSSDYHAVKDASIAAAENLMSPGADYPLTEKDLKNVKNAWAAVGLGVIFEIFDQESTPVFSTNEFTAIGVGKGGHVWAGTKQQGLYKYNSDSWTKATTAISDYEINDIKPDKKGGIWIGEGGKGFENYNAGGGVFYYPDSSFDTKTYYGTNQGLASRHVSSIFIDTTNGLTTDFPKVWAAERFMYNDPLSPAEIYSGKVSRLKPDGTAFFTTQDIADDGSPHGFNAVGGNKDEVWAFRTYTNQLLKYNPSTSLPDVVTDMSSISAIPFNMDTYVNAIYFDKYHNDNKWLGLADSSALTHTGGIIVQENSSWKLVPQSIVPRFFNVSYNAITGDDSVIYIGTNRGLLIYNNLGIDDTANYQLLTVADGLPSDRVNGLCFDSTREGLWIATNKGIAFLKRNYDTRTLFIECSMVKCNPNQRKVTLTTLGVFHNTPVKNKFTIKLSDAEGNFENAVTLATDETAPAERYVFTKIVNLPANFPIGYKYSISVTSTNPPMSAISSPLDMTYITETVPNQFYKADYQCENTDGWTDYYYSRGLPENLGVSAHILLLSIKKNGNHLGTVDHDASDMDVIVGTTPKARTLTANLINDPNLVETPFWSLNRFWKVIVIPANQPATDNPVDVRFYYNDEDLQDVNGSQPGNPVDHTGLVLFKTDGNPTSANPDPFAGASYVVPYTHEVNGNTRPTITWKHTDMGGGKHMAEFQVTSFSGGGAGVTLNGGPLTITPTTSLKSGNWSDPATWSTGIVPIETTAVTIQHDVKVDINANCKSIKIETASGKITVNTGFNLKVFQ